MSIHQSNLSVEVFCSYAPGDEGYLRELEKHLSMLQRQRLISLWHNRQIPPGADWTRVIDKHLGSASIILLLISANFMASDYCYGVEMKRALERHRRGEAQVVPILISPVDWKHAPFAHLRALPINAKPLSLWTDKDAALADISENLRRLLEGEPLLETNPSPTPSPSSNWPISLKTVGKLFLSGILSGSILGILLLVLSFLYENTSMPQTAISILTIIITILSLILGAITFFSFALGAILTFFVILGLALRK